MTATAATGFAIPVILATRRVPADTGALVFDLKTGTIYRGHNAWAFTHTHFWLLLILAVNQGRHLSVRGIVERFWLDDPDGGPVTAENVMRVNICQTNALGRGIGLVICNDRRFGYVLADRAGLRRAA